MVLCVFLLFSFAFLFHVIETLFLREEHSLFQHWTSSSIVTVFLVVSLLPIVTWMAPTLVSLNIPIASEWVKPATDRPLTEKISSPELKIKLVGITTVVKVLFLMNISQSALLQCKK